MSELANRLRSQSRSWAHPGSSHDRAVRTALVVLPIGIGALFAFLVTAPLFMGGDVSFVLDKNKVAMSPERLRIDSADYRGEDTKGRQFELHAGSAVQKSSAEPVVQLQDLSARLQLPEGPATLVANHGRYNLNSDQVAIDGPIRFQTSDGYTLNTNDATVDLKTRKLASGGAVTGNTPTGTFSANRLTADLDRRVISLEGNARLRMVPKQTKRP
ncbi:LPS export ABC transporter periplasmic protein LptC [Sphingomonas sp. HT-1]|uniref:LPS export ABC transporter periplasmic protein LptC n=1 Tax=unclassified Sphingomonas TaxID=196159 RepID=UPI000370FA47|nr:MULTISPECIES: LPS export ABC transporter periplasmic protein LptC [unclassified Sphingomonas]KTF68225.1 LPS export ABC transporter periplasmic protein LptC [Sphingomonas sp. WG]